jgi:hypothetical protein
MGGLTLQRISRPIQDDQEIELVNSSIRVSVHKKDILQLTLYDAYQFKTVTGMIERVDHQLKQVKFVHFNPFVEEPEWEWLKLKDGKKRALREGFQ